MKLSDIQDLIKFVSKSGVSEVEIEDKDFKINIKTPPYRKGKGNVQEVHTQAPMMQPQAGMQQMMHPQNQEIAHAAPAPAPSSPSPAESKKAEEDNYVVIKSPMIGTFYRKPSPDKAEFVNVGDIIKEGDTVCVIEAMKLFNEIEAEVKGKVVKILVDDSTPVQYDQPLILIDPS